jgi:hypothetical protein
MHRSTRRYELNVNVLLGLKFEVNFLIVRIRIILTMCAVNCLFSAQINRERNRSSNSNCGSDVLRFVRTMHMQCGWQNHRMLCTNQHGELSAESAVRDNLLASFLL